MLALDGIRVLEMCTAIGGPYCGQILADLGADVIKIEHPGRAAGERENLSPADWDGPPFAPFWLATNRNKRSVTLDLKQEEGKEVLRDLVRVSDVAIENFGADARSRLVDEQWAWAVNPRLVWASLSFCGRTGPDSGLNGYDFLAQARSGLLGITGFPDSPPVKTGNSATDFLAGSHLAIGVLGALRQRDVTGRGQLVDISLLETAVACLDGFPMWHTIAGLTPHRAGNAHLSRQIDFEMLECKDGFVAVSSGWTERLLQEVLSRPELLPLPDPDDREFSSRLAIINEAISAWFQERTVEEASDALRQARINNAPVQNLAQIWDDTQLEDRGMFVEYEQRGIGRFKAIGSPLHLSESSRQVRRFPPGAGEHNEEVLTEILDYGADRMKDLVDHGVLGR